MAGFHLPITGWFCLPTDTYDTTDIADYHWDYDAFGRITVFTFAFSDAEDGSSTFSYDATGQLTAADHTAQDDESFEYDENGNRTMSGYDTGDNNLLLSDGVFDYVYDLEGNRISRTRISSDPADDKTVEYTWDHRNRLTRVLFKDNSNDLTKEVIYEYDAFNRRITKIIDADGEGAGAAEQTDFIYDGQDIVLALDDQGDVTNRYLHGPAIDMVLADEQVYNELLWTPTDNQGSVRDLVDNAGNVESHIDYTSFGKVDLITDDLVQTVYGFTGRERDAETGLNYHRARYYDPVIGRWLSEDPIGFAAGDANLQRYVNNDPVNFMDPTGESDFWNNYWHFLTNPSDMDDDLETGFYVAAGTAAVAGVAAGGLVVGAAGLKAGATWAATEAFDTGVEAGLGWATGMDIMIPMSPSDLLQDGTKWLLKRGARKALGKSAGKAADDMSWAKIGEDLNPDGGCFVAGTDVTMAPAGDGALLAEAAEPAGASPGTESLGSAAIGAAAIGAVGYMVANRRKKTDDRRGRALTAGTILSASTAHSKRGGAVENAETEAAASVCVLDERGGPPANDDDFPSDSRVPSAAPGRPRFGAFWLAAWLLLATGLWFGQSFVADDSRVPNASATIAAARITQPIEQIEVGQRVAVDAATAEQDLVFGTSVDPATWRRVTLRAPKRDGGWADVVLLRPAGWLAQRGAAVGGTIEINVPECGIEGLAEVLSIGPCPAIASGNGRIVTGTFRHSAANIIDLHVEGLSEPIGTTANHPFWSIDRQSFVRADSLQTGERLRGAGDSHAVIRIERRPAPEAVYNLEIQVDHVYHVGTAGLLVHNGADDLVNCSEKLGTVDSLVQLDNGGRLRANKQAGDAWERKVVDEKLPVDQNTIREQITVKSNGPSGMKTKVDAIGTDNNTGVIRLTESKASQTAKLTPNQGTVHPELETHGGVIVGRGKAPYVGGTRIPPTKVDVIRPPLN